MNRLAGTFCDTQLFLPFMTLQSRFHAGLLRIFLVCACLAAAVHDATAQTVPVSPKTIRDSKGKDFWLAFPRNHHQIGSATYLDNIYISIASERPTSGQIEFKESGRVRVEKFTIGANGFYTLELPSLDLEITEDRVGQKSFHITANEEVAVYGLSVANTTSDAFLAFPTDVLGKNYVITSYPSNYFFQSIIQNGMIRRINDPDFSTMSQFALLGVEDSTIVTVFPTERVWGARTNATFTVRLNRGDTYLVSNYVTATTAQIDYTGSRVISSKPLVVYAGHERAAIPLGTGASRDYLVEQMLPVEVWGKNALVVPYPTPVTGRPDPGCDRVRVVAALNNTIVSVNGTTVATLRAGGFYEMIISTDASITTSEPTMVCGYKCSSQSPQSNSPSGLGDPFLAAIPPVEQFLTRYRFSCVQGQQVAATGRLLESAFVEHFLTVIVPTEKTSTLVLDGRAVAAQNFRPIRQSGYSTATLRIGEGIHNVSADTTFGITVAGYGRANSYGYIGGQRFESDIRPPEIAVNRTCTGLSATAFDNSFNDSRIFFYDTLRGEQQNIRFRFGSLPRPADSLTFQADLVNPYNDGRLGVIIVDSLDLRTAQRLVVPGFTVHANPQIRTNAVIATSAVMRLSAGTEYCLRLTLTNYGVAPQTIQNADFVRGLKQFTIKNRLTPFNIAPSSEATIEYCFRPSEEGIFEDTLVISNACLTRPILALRFQVVQDRTAPTLAQSSLDSCRRSITLDVADNGAFEGGLASINLTLSNFTARQILLGSAATEPDSSRRVRRLILTVANPRNDAVYRLVAKDSAGNELVRSDTIGGFSVRFRASPDTIAGRFRDYSGTMTLPSAPDMAGEYAFTPIDAASLTCGTILVQNTGIVPFVLDRAFFSQHIRFSAPSSQFPLTIPPRASRPIVVCFNPDIVSAYRDTLTIEKFCIAEKIALVGEGLPVQRLATSRCNVEVIIRPPTGNVASASASNTPSKDRLTQSLNITTFPDPAHDEITLRITLAEPETVRVRMYSMLGVLIAELPEQPLQTGLWDVVLRVNGIETGTYSCEVQSTEGTNKRWRGLMRIAR